MAVSEKPPANGFVRYARKLYNPLGFTRGYNFVLCKSTSNNGDEIPAKTQA